MLGYLAGIPGRLKTLVDRLTATRAGYLDNLSAGAVAQAATALSTAQWTNTRAALLDGIIQTSVIASIQSGYVSGAATTGSGEDTRYIDTTITAVASTAKCVVLFQPMADTAGGTTVGFSARLTSTSNVRVASRTTTAPIGRWTVIEFK